MKHCLSHWSAFRFWNIPFAQEVFGRELTAASPVEVTVFKRNERYRRKGHCVHLCQLEIPDDAIREINGQKVASPEFMFLQLANSLDIQRLILLGILLCSSPQGQVSKAITNKKKLAEFAKRMKGHRGRRKAMRAVKYIEDHCRSLLEACLYLFLALPNALGGCGFRHAVFNHKIQLSTDGARALGQSVCFADLYFKRARLVVEYDSFSLHNNANAYGRDAERATVLRRQRYKVVNMKTSQLYKLKAFQQFARHLALLLKKRIRIRTTKFHTMFYKLRTLLPRKRDQDSGVVSVQSSRHRDNAAKMLGGLVNNTSLNRAVVRNRSG